MVRIRKNKLMGLVLFLVIYLMTFSNNQFQSVKSFWSTNGWEKISPINEKMNGIQLNQIDSYFQNWNNEHPFSHVDQFIVIRNGYLIKEWYSFYYDASDIHPLWSVTKSFICTLIGIAIKEGYIPGVDANILDYFTDRTIANLDSRKEAITIEHLLMMSTGLAYPGDDVIWVSWMNADDQVQYILDLPMATEPGTIFNYDTGGSHLLSSILQKATNMSTIEFAEQYLFEPLGISHYYWLKDKQGIAYGGHGLHLTPNDMAKLGYLYLNDGYCEGKQLLPDNWIEEVTQTQWEFSSEWGYGKQWWTHPYYNGYSAQGRYGQCVFVFPNENIIVVYTGTISDSDTLNVLQINVDFVLASIITAIEELSIELFIPFTASFLVVVFISIIKIKKRK